MQFIDNNIIYKIGRNAKDNFKLIDCADSNDWWFHLSDCPSGHCIVMNDVLTHEMILFAGNLVKQNSKMKDKRVKIIYTQIKNIKKTTTIGQVKILCNPLFFYI